MGPQGDARPRINCRPAHPVRPRRSGTWTDRGKRPHGNDAVDRGRRRHRPEVSFEFI